MKKAEKILRELGIDKFKLKDVSKGFDNKVYTVDSYGVKFVLRIPIKEKNKITAQAYAFEKWRKLGIPVPEILFVSNEFIIEEFIEGRNFSESKLTEKQKQEVLSELGKHVKKMHKVKANKFGYMKEPGIGHSVSWESFFLKDFDDNLRELNKKRLISSELSLKSKKFFDSNKKLLELKQGRLIHADLGQDNILIKNEKLSGIIDASDSMSGDPYYDLAVIRYAYGDKLMESFLRGYGRIGKKKLDFYTVYYLIWMILFNNTIAKNKKQAKEDINFLKKVIK